MKHGLANVVREKDALASMNELFRFGRDEEHEREADECDRMAKEMLADPE